MINLKTKYIVDYISIVLNKKSENIDNDDLKSIKSIMLNSTDIAGEHQQTFIEDLEFLPNLEEIDILNIIITDETIKYISMLEKLKSINFYNCEFSAQIKNMCNLKKIEKLKFNTTKPNDISSINNLCLLKSFGLVNLTIIDLSFIKELINLEEIDFSNSKILDIDIENLLKNINVLKISNTNIRKIEFLKNLNSLKKIYVDKSQYIDNLDIINCLREKNISIFDENNYMYDAN